MNALELLRSNADHAAQEFRASLEGVTQSQAWAVLPNLGPDYLHSDGSIHGIALHVAGCKRAYASICFRNTEIRWRDIADEIERFEPDWQAGVEYVEKAHAYWLESWSDLRDEELEKLRPTNWAKPWPAWQLLQLMSHHDSYHAGQIAVLRYGCADSDQPPPSVAEDVRKYCRESVHW